jgi:hypothetical protein
MDKNVCRIRKTAGRSTLAYSAPVGIDKNAFEEIRKPAGTNTLAYSAIYDIGKLSLKNEKTCQGQPHKKYC